MKLNITYCNHQKKSKSDNFSSPLPSNPPALEVQDSLKCSMELLTENPPTIKHYCQMLITFHDNDSLGL